MAANRAAGAADAQLPVVLLTGFEPFGGDPFNPSAAIAARLAGHRVAAAGGPAPGGPGAQAIVRSVELPCVFDESIRQLEAAIRRHRPVAVIALGLAASRSEVGIERIAINLDDARIPDNAGHQPVDRPIRPGGPAACWSTLPVKAIVAAITAAGLPAATSQTAGTFVCNHLFYGLAWRLARMRPPRPRGGFIHVPMPAEHGGSGPSLDALVDAIRIAVAVTVGHRGEDLPIAGGALC